MKTGCITPTTILRNSSTKEEPTVEVVANQKAVTPADVDLHANIRRGISRCTTTSALEEINAACVTWAGIMAALTMPKRAEQRPR